MNIGLNTSEIKDHMTSLQAKTINDKISEKLRKTTGIAQESLKDFAYNYNDINYYQSFNNTENKKELTWSASISKSVLGVLIGVLEKQYSAFKSSTTIVKDNLPPNFSYENTVLDNDSLTLEDLMCMNAGILYDSINKLNYIPYSTLDKSFPLFNTETASKIYLTGCVCNTGNTGTGPQKYFTGSALSNLQSILKNADGKPIQMQSNSDYDNKAGFNSSIVGEYNKSDPKPSKPGYSTASIDMAGLVFQVLVKKHVYGDEYNELCTMHELEEWARDNLFSPLGCPEIRLLSDASYEVWMAGSSTLVNTEFNVNLMKLLINGDGKYNDTELINPDYAAKFLKEDSGYILDNSGKVYFNGVWRGHNNEQSILEFRGIGGIYTVGVYTDMKAANKNTIISASRKSGRTPLALRLQTKTNEVCAQYILPSELMFLLEKSMTSGMQNDTTSAHLQSCLWSGLGPTLFGTVFYPRWAEMLLEFAQDINL